MKVNVVIKLQEMAVSEAAESTDSWASGISFICSVKDIAATQEADIVVTAA
ncbi:hypothetical protein [Schleiferilactobacillus harbinensis]|uniref:hypothetical protein n=1 Tax=Schleiferilactobacillus harbinensis TaxID=304207 RepID=UPI00186B55A1|nr:hypothetical protein [Schleiferilactobacillus harbinensis]